MARVSTDIAYRSGVSAATVSLVLNGKDKDGRINEALAGKIRNESKVLNDKQNHLAKGLRSGYSETIGLFFLIFFQKNLLKRFICFIFVPSKK